MTLHPGKSKYMVIGSQRYLKTVSSMHISINNTALENVTCQKILGIYVDNALKWNLQIENVYKKIN